MPGPRAAEEIEHAEEIAPGVLLARGTQTRVRGRDVVFGESHMAAFLGEPTLLLDVRGGPAAIAAALDQAAAKLGCDLLVFIDVGGDVLAHGHEPGLGSPLCDALVLAAAARLARDGKPVLGGIFGIGCDGELTVAEVTERLVAVGRAGGFAGARGLTPAVAQRLEQAVAHVPTEASAQALRAFRGEAGPTSIRGGRRTLELTPAAAGTIYFDVLAAVASGAPLAHAVDGCASLGEANAALNALGVRTELDWELENAAR